ncbi:DNA-damage-repair/toleration protein DRT102 [Spatholobus suberectus]|nr:DNA-damage-repair/toleration protein DRT102 [Spatholobus suberectus]
MRAPSTTLLVVSSKYTSPRTAIQILIAWLNMPFKSACPANDSMPWAHEIQSFFDNLLVEMCKSKNTEQLIRARFAVC